MSHATEPIAIKYGLYTNLVLVTCFTNSLLTVPGRTDYTVGQKVIINVDRIEPMKKGETNTRDEIISGAYIIGAINHYIDREKHECVMELFKESMLKNMNGRSK
jgi:hypothetical protein